MPTEKTSHTSVVPHCDLLVNTSEIMGFSIDAHDVTHLHLGFLIEPSALDITSIS